MRTPIARSRGLVAALLLTLVASTVGAQLPRLGCEPVKAGAPSDRICIHNLGGAATLQADDTSTTMLAVLFLPKSADPGQVKVTAGDGWSVAIDGYQVPNRALILRLLPLRTIAIAADTTVTCLEVEGVNVHDLDRMGFWTTGPLDED